MKLNTSYLKNLLFRIPLKERILFAKHLAIMTKAGMPILDSIGMLEKQTKNRDFKKIIHGLMVDIDNGQFLSTSLEKYRSIFGDLFIDIIRIGEASGTLSENLNYLAQELEKKRALYKKVKGALIYPTIVLTATLGVTWLLSFFVMPRLFPIFEGLGVELPASTRALIWFSNFTRSYTIHMVVVIFLAYVIFRILLNIESFRYLWHRMLLGVPIFGKLLKQYNMALFSRTLGILLRSGVHIVEAINVTGQSLSNVVYRRELKRAAEQIQKGQTLNKYLQSREKLFPSTLSRMIEVGETTGNLDNNLEYLAEFFESELDDVTKNLSSIMEPILLLIMGGLVGFVAISVLLPIYSLTSSF